MSIAPTASISITGNIPLILSGNYLSWSEEIRNKLLKLTLTGESEMNLEIRSGRNFMTCVAFLEDEPIGWSIHIPKSVYGQDTFMVYVHYKYRMMGIGRSLIIAAKVASGITHPTVIAWSLESYNFYNKINKECELNMEVWDNAPQTNET